MYESYEELKRKETNPEIVEGFIEAIVMQAVKDIRSNLCNSKNAPTWMVNLAKENKIDAINFIKSEWFYCLTETNGNYLLKKLAEECDLENTY